MKRVVLDTSFILTAVKQKIDFFEEIGMMGFEILIPNQVINELKRLKAGLALNILGKNKFKTVYPKGTDADSVIINFARENKGIIVATLDREIKGRVKNPKLVIRQKKKLEVIQ